MRDYCGAAMKLGDGAEIDRECELDLLAFAQSEIGRFDEHSRGGEIDRPAKFLSPGRGRDVHRRARTVPRMQPALHRLDPRCCCFTHQALLWGLLPCETSL